MVEPGDIRPIDCACGKVLIFASEKGIEVPCRACRRRVFVPFESLAGQEHSRLVLRPQASMFGESSFHEVAHDPPPPCSRIVGYSGCRPRGLPPLGSLLAV